MIKLIRNFISALQGKTFIDSILKDFEDMMKELFEMFDKSTLLLFKKKSKGNIAKFIYKEDIFINKAERKIRKRIVEHFAVQPGVDIGPSLIMMSIVKDAERIGDYCKNLFELGAMISKFNEKNKYYSTFLKMRDNILNLIKITDISFRNKDIKKAQGIMDKTYKIEKKCDKLIIEFSKSKLSTNHAVCLTLLSRHFKRISAHLSNITSSVLFPVHKIDFVRHKKKR